MNYRSSVLGWLVGVMLFVPPITAHAYIGPGLGLGAIGGIIGVLASIFLVIFAVLWYPIKKILKQRKLKLEIDNLKETDNLKKSENHSKQDIS